MSPKFVSRRAKLLAALTLIFVVTAGLAACGSSDTDQVTVTGTVTYRERIALPPEATLTISVLDTSRQDVAAATLGEQTIELDGSQQVPISFAVPVDASSADASASYAVRATIRDGNDALLWTTDTVYPVDLTAGDTDVGELLLVGV